MLLMKNMAGRRRGAWHWGGQRLKLYSASLMNFNHKKFGIMMRVFGISNCDKCREAKKWLAKKEMDFEFIDFRKQTLTAEDIKRWIKKRWRRETYK